VSDWLKAGGTKEELLKLALAASASLSETEEQPINIKWQSFPAQSLPEPLQSYVRAAAQAIGCDESYVALPLLAALAAAVGNTCRIQLKRGWTEPAVIWTVIIGESGTLKSPGMDAPLRPIRKRQAEAWQRHQNAVTEYEHLQLTYKADAAEWQ